MNTNEEKKYPANVLVIGNNVFIIDTQSPMDDSYLLTMSKDEYDKTYSK